MGILILATPLRLLPENLSTGTAGLTIRRNVALGQGASVLMGGGVRIVLYIEVFYYVVLR